MRISLGDALVGKPDVLQGSDLLAFANIPPVWFPVYPVAQHLAEKLHAYTLPRGQPNTRVKDLVDMVAMAAIDQIDADALARSVEATFSARGTQAVPSSLPDPPSGWQRQYARLAGDSPTAPTRDLAEAMQLVRSLWDPLLRSEVAVRTWHPGTHLWT
jgi:hypothetical protein